MVTVRRLLGGATLVAPAGPLAGPLARLQPLDATLGVEGLPQSATGQTTLLTGRNASAILGHHHPGYPTPTLIALLEEHSIFRYLRKMGRTGTFANTFTKDYFRRVEHESGDRRLRLSATTHAARAGEVPFRMVESYLQGESVPHDMTGEMLVVLGQEVPLTQPREAGLTLSRLLNDFDFVLFEFFLTDRAGHAQDELAAIALLERIDAALGGVVDAMDPNRDTVILTSDHGNIEDLSIRTHTRNPVPALVVGARAEKLSAEIRSIQDITPAILRCLA